MSIFSRRSTNTEATTPRAGESHQRAEPIDEPTPGVARPGEREQTGGPARERPVRRVRPRRGMAWRTRDAGAVAVGAVGSGVILIARLVMALATLIALLIALAIVLRDVDANQANTIVKGIHEGANFFAGAFTGLIAFHGHPKRAITVDWGIALLVYLVVGGFLAGYIRRIGRGGLRYERAHRTALR